MLQGRNDTIKEENNMTEKEIFIEGMKTRTKKFAVGLPKRPEKHQIYFQDLKSFHH